MSGREQPTVENPGFDVVVPLDRMWSASVALEVFRTDDGRPAARLEATDRVCQPLGLLHGGIYACVAEELASVGTGEAVIGDGRLGVGQSNLTHFLRSVRRGGTLHAEAWAIHRGRSSWVWEVECRDEDGRLCAKSTVTMAVRDLPTDRGG